MDKKADELFDLAFSNKRVPDKSEIFVSKKMPEGEFASLDLSRFRVINTAGHPIENCRVWFPKGYSLHLRPRLVFEIVEPVKDCNFFFFRIPDKRSKLKFSLIGNGHSAVFFSTRRMTIYARMANNSSHLTVGEAVFIGGASLALDNTTLTIGACGLWSDGILIQGTDSHGVVDLDRMEIINEGAKHITLRRRVWLGRQAKVMKNVTIGEGSMVATGSIVVKDVPPACAVAGVPAKVVKERVSWTHKQHFISEFDKREMLKLRAKLDASPVAQRASS